ncbi:hypothetical protein [Fredinandcohnia onubensis]|uniref:hypothetical protein n=1 Tax=Fredinandcohnia onubensis TaxID=1571209 RepID=UPI000C0C002F|nr:hypothetical protein [Fredinandcohnia onubensis]
MSVYYQNQRFSEVAYSKESELERDVVQNAELFFGQRSIYIDAKKKIEGKSLGGSIPDGFLFDLSDLNNPVFYIVEAELSQHSFYGHIFPQITKFFAFFNNRKSQDELINKLYSLVQEDKEITEKFRSLIGRKELYKFMKDTVETSRNILIIIDGEKKELPDIMETYGEWGNTVKLLILKKYSDGKETIFTLDPDFENVEYSVMNIDEDADEEVKKEYTEKIHMDYAIDKIKNLYLSIRGTVKETYPEAEFNATKYYIGLRRGENKKQAIFIFNKRSLRIVLMREEDLVRPMLPSHPIKSLSASVQKFWNGSCCEVQLSDDKNMNEVVNVILDMLDKNNS